MMVEYGNFVVIRDRVKLASTVLECLGSIEQIVEVRNLDQLPLRVRTLRTGFTYSYSEDQIVPLTDEQMMSIVKENEKDPKSALQIVKNIVKEFKDDVLIPAAKQGIFLSDGKLYTVENIPFERNTFTQEERDMLRRAYDESPEKALKLLEELDKKALEEKEPTASECVVVVPAEQKESAKPVGVQFSWGADEWSEATPGIDFKRLAEEAKAKREQAQTAEKNLGFTVEEKSYEPQQARKQQVVSEAPVDIPDDDIFVEPYLHDVYNGYKIMLYSRFGKQSPRVTRCNFLVVQPDGKIVTNSHINVSQYPPYKEYIVVNREDVNNYSLQARIAIRKMADELYRSRKIVKVDSGEEARFYAEQLTQEAAAR